jgi:HNH endonuclease
MRIGISKKTRFDVFKRDGFQCAYCGAHPSETVLLEVDHIHPVAEGGTNDMDNLVTACWDCNRGKGAGLLSSVPQSLEEKAAVTLEREAQIRAYYEVLELKKERKDAEIWMVSELFMQRFGDEDIHRSRFASIRTFLEYLNVYEVIEAMEIACDKKYSKGAAFSYFCGICWNKIKRPKGERV